MGMYVRRLSTQTDTSMQGSQVSWFGTVVDIPRILLQLYKTHTCD